MPGRRRIVGGGEGGQGLLTVVAVSRGQDDDAVDAFRGQASFEVGRMSGLGSGSSLTAFLRGQFGGVGGIGGGRDARVGGVGGEARFEFGQAAFEGREACVAFQTSRTRHRSHDAIIETRQARSCA